MQSPVELPSGTLPRSNRQQGTNEYGNITVVCNGRSSPSRHQMLGIGMVLTPLLTQACRLQRLEPSTELIAQRNVVT